MNNMMDGKAMELINNLSNSIDHLLLSLDSKKTTTDVDIDCYGVGAMMPQDMPEEVLLNNTALYGV